MASATRLIFATIRSEWHKQSWGKSTTLVCRWSLTARGFGWASCRFISPCVRSCFLSLLTKILIQPLSSAALPASIKSLALRLARKLVLLCYCQRIALATGFHLASVVGSRLAVPLSHNSLKFPQLEALLHMFAWQSLITFR